MNYDELLGYDESKMEEEINEIIRAYQMIPNEEKFKGNCELINKARKKYPHDYRIAEIYVMDLVGGYADNDSNVLIKHSPEIFEICNDIKKGCKDIKTSLNALYLEAKVLRALGKTKEALTILDDFPSYFHSSNQKKEQLFDKGSKEYYEALAANLTELTQYYGDKLAKSVIYSDKTNAEKLELIQRIGQVFDQITVTAGMEQLLMLKRIYWGRVLSHPSPILIMDQPTIIRFYDKKYQAIVEVNKLLTGNALFKEETNITEAITSDEKWHPELLTNQAFLSLKKKYLGN